MSFRISRLLRTIKATPKVPIGTAQIRKEGDRHLVYRMTSAGWKRSEGESVAMGYASRF
jgi:hypothetical protein